MTHVIAAFRNFPNEPKNLLCGQIPDVLLFNLALGEVTSGFQTVHYTFQTEGLRTADVGHHPRKQEVTCSTLIQKMETAGGLFSLATIAPTARVT